MESEFEPSGSPDESPGKPPSVLFTQIVLGLCSLGAFFGSGILATPAAAAQHPVIFLFYVALGGLPIWLIIEMNARHKWTRWVIICYLPVAAIMFPLLLNSGISAGLFPPLIPSPASAGAALFEKVRFVGLLVLALALAFEPRAKQFLNRSAKGSSPQTSQHTPDNS